MSDPEWRQRYRDKRVTRRQTLGRILAGASSFIGDNTRAALSAPGSTPTTPS